MSDDLKAKWAQASKEAALTKAEEDFRVTETELLAAYDPSVTNEDSEARSIAVDKALEDEWQHLKRIAMTQFPEGARILGLTANNRLVAVATCLGWGPKKINEASGGTIGLRTVHSWLKRPDVQLFMREFNLRSGIGNTDILKEKLSELEYLSINTVMQILKDQEASEGMKRLKLDASKWVMNLTRSRADDGSVGLRSLLEALGKLAAAQPSQLSPEDEEKIFSKPIVN